MSQKVSAGSEASVVVSGRDTNIGFSKEDMKAVIESVAAQLPQYAVIAKAIVDERLEMFEKKILERFEAGQGTNTGAFADPDFQYLLGRAQHAYARSGDDATAEVLIDLIASRSVQKSRTRLTLSLNEAVERSAYLTENEFSEIAMCFALRYSVRNGISNIAELCAYLRTFAESLLPHISKEESSYSYIQAQACGHLESLSRIDLHGIFTEHYGTLISLGSSREDFKKTLGANFDERYPGLLKPSSLGQEKFQVKSLGRQDCLNVCKKFGIANKGDELWLLSTAGLLDEKQVVKIATQHFWGIKDLYAIWRDTPLGSLSLTSIGLAIGYAKIRRTCEFQADLGIWIR